MRANSDVFSEKGTLSMNTIARTLAFGILFFAMPDGAVQSEGVSVHNCGRPGANTPESLVRLPGVLASKPDHLVILLGMNDALNACFIHSPSSANLP
jgi:hypothetical protein